MRRILMALAAALCLVTQAAAQEALPDRRLVVTRDMDFYGGDLQPLFDTTLEACQSLCLNDPDCGAFTFNSRSRACFPKTGVSDRQPYDGAVSAEVVAADPARVAEARARLSNLDFLEETELRAAHDEAAALGARHGGGEWSVGALLDAARPELRRQGRHAPLVVAQVVCRAVPLPRAGRDERRQPHLPRPRQAGRHQRRRLLLAGRRRRAAVGGQSRRRLDAH